MAIACFVERAPCLPSRICSISSCPNSPACVLGDFPSALSLAARLRVSFSGIFPPLPLIGLVQSGLRPRLIAWQLDFYTWRGSYTWLLVTKYVQRDWYCARQARQEKRPAHGLSPLFLHLVCQQ